MFYHDIKEHASPSSLAQWFDNRSGFIRSYFRGEKSPETAAMVAGKKTHALIEAGVIPAQCVYGVNEEKIEVYAGKDKQFKFMGIPDDRTRGATRGIAHFVDYKTGKANDWKEKLPTDLKMKATAWLVWKVTSEPKKVRGCVEYIATEWDADAKEVVVIEGRKTEVIKIEYDAEDLAKFEAVIVKAMNDINDEYEKWKDSANLVSVVDAETYVELRKERDQIEFQMGIVGERIMDQMEAGGTSNVPASAGSFYVTERKTFEYPKDLRFKFGDAEWSLETAGEVESAAKAAKKNYELTAEPKTVTKSLGFRAHKEKK